MNQKIDRRTKLAEALLAMFIVGEPLRAEITTMVRPEDFLHPHRELYLFLVSEYHTFNAQQIKENAESSAFFAIIRNRISRENIQLISLLDRLALAGGGWYGGRAEKELRQELARLVQGIREMAVREERGTLAQAVRSAEAHGDHNQVTELMKKFNELI